MTHELELLVGTASIVFAFCLFAAWRAVASMRHSRRMADLAQAQRLILVHKTTLAELLASDSINDERKTRIVLFSDILLDPERVRDITHEFTSAKLQERRPAPDAIATLAQTLVPPDLEATFKLCIEAAFKATVFRWADLAAIYRRIAIDLFAQPQRQNILLGVIAAVGGSGASSNRDWAAA